MTLLREIQVENAIRKFLREKFGDENVQTRESPRGVDICYVNDLGEVCQVEVEGNANKDLKPLRSASARYTHFYRCLGQICKDIGLSAEGTIFEIGLPVDSVYEAYVRTALRAFKLLGIRKIH